MAAQVKIEVDGLREARAAVRKAGGSLDDLEDVNRRAAGIIQAEAVNRAPHRSGRLRGSIGVEASPTTGKVVSSGAVVYAPVVHFGWVTRNAARGLSRKEAQTRLGGALSRRSINKSVAGQRTRVSRRGGVVVQTRGKIRGGPIKPNPYLYLAADARVDEVFATYEQKADDIAKALADG
jgi:hypothetical protein